MGYSIIVQLLKNVLALLWIRKGERYEKVLDFGARLGFERL